MTPNEYPFDLEIYKKAYDNNPQAFAIFYVSREESGAYKDMFFVYVNEEFAKLAGYTQDELIGRNYSEVVEDVTGRKWDVAPWTDFYGPVAYNGHVRKRIVPAPVVGKQSNHYLSAQAFQIAEGYAGANLLDVTEMISEDDSRLRKFNEIITTNSNLFIWEIDFKNDLYYRIAFGETKEAIERMENPLDYLSGRTDDDGKKELLRLLDTVKQGENVSGTIRFYVKDLDEPLVFMLNMIPEKEGGEVTGTFGITQDITEQHRAQEQLNYLLSKENKILEEVALSENDFIATLEFETGATELHHGTWYKKGKPTSPDERRRSIHDMIRFGSSKLLKEEDKEKFEAVLQPEELERQLYKKGSVSYVFDYKEAEPGEGPIRKMFRFIMLDKAKRIALWLMTDITETYKKDLQLEEALHAALEANMSKLNFISRISHDIRTPLSAVKSMTEFAFQDIGDEEKIKHDLTNIRNSSEFLNSLINDILDVSKIDSGQTELHPEPYSYKRCKEEFGALINAEAKKKGLTLKLEEHDSGHTFLVDPTRIRQVVLNVIMNAIRYTPEGGTITISSSDEPLYEGMINFILSVKDTGIGMSEKFLKHIFQPFQQDENNEERRKLGGGTGLGLYIVKRMTELMGGSVDVKSELGKGTEMILTIPAMLTNASDGANDIAVPSKEPEVKISGRVLLFEDNPINTEIAIRILSVTGLEVENAVDGREGVEMFEKSGEGYYDVILMDIQMPLMDGYEASAAIRALDRKDAKEIPIIAMTADAFDDAKKKAIESGMDDYITKPLDSKKMKKMIAKYVAADE